MFCAKINVIKANQCNDENWYWQGYTLKHAPWKNGQGFFKEEYKYNICAKGEYNDK
jgi:hypothetical protein